MKYCVRYSKSFEYIDEVDEFKIIYKPNDSTLIDFLNTFQEKRIIISVTEEDMQTLVLEKKLEIYAAIEKKNFSFLLPAIIDDNKKTTLLFVEKMRQLELPFFFNEKIYSIDKVWELITLGVSDVYICGELGFDLRNISKRIKEAGVVIRVYPDVAQSTAASADPLTKFYIRPEDMEFYEDYVDVCEFFADDKTRDNVLYKVYAINKKWYNDLNLIILDFNYEIDNKSFPRAFGEMRNHCRKRCLREGKCKLCESAYMLSKLLNENNLFLKEDE